MLLKRTFTVSALLAAASCVAPGSLAAPPSRLSPGPAVPSPQQLLVYGRSAQGRSLQAYVLGEGSNETLIFGGFHGNERSSPGVIEKLHTYLLQHPEQWRGCQIILVPCANPDGWKAGTRDNAHHVDLNRNFPGTWQPRRRKRRYNPGPAAASEPETQAILRLVTLYAPAKILSLHQPLHLLNWTGSRGRSLAAVMAQHNHYPVSDSVGYATPGSLGDFYGRRGVAMITLELPAATVATGWKQNRDALLAAITAEE